MIEKEDHDDNDDDDDDDDSEKDKEVEGGDAKDNKEFWGDRLGGIDGVGGIGGFGGFGCNRFGYTYHGFSGWAYPLSYWNTYGSGIYGGSCGLRLSYGSLYYC